MLLWLSGRKKCSSVLPCSVAGESYIVYLFLLINLLESFLFLVLFLELAFDSVDHFYHSFVSFPIVSASIFMISLPLLFSGLLCSSLLFLTWTSNSFGVHSYCYLIVASTVRYFPLSTTWRLSITFDIKYPHCYSLSNILWFHYALYINDEFKHYWDSPCDQ